MKPVLRYPGSKWRIADWIISHMPPHVHYLEPYFGSGAVLFRKPRSKIETVNDTNGDVVNLFRVLREHPHELADAVHMTPWSREEYRASYEQLTGDALEDARRFLVRCWQAYGTRLYTSTGWKNEIRSATGKPVTRTWRDLPSRIITAAERLRGVQIDCAPAIEVIKRLAGSHVLIYADPPYLGVPPLYSQRTSEQEHRELIATLREIPGTVLLSGYASELYAADLADWSTVRTRGMADAGREREEILWLNPVAAKMQEGMLF